jgi:hypothetical protein
LTIPTKGDNLMTVAVASPVTGAAETGLTSPTYTHVADTPPNAWSKQYAVTAIGGTQAGVDTASSVAKPFTLTASRPQSLKTLAVVDPVTGQLRSVPMNDYNIITRKGVVPLSGQAPKTMIIRSTFSVPAGADAADAPNIRAAASFHIGALWATSSGIGDTLVNGVL